MLEQQQIHAEEQKRYAPTAYENDNVLALTPHANALVAAYVAQVESEQQEATRTRLEQLIAAHLELDADPEQAARSAIQQLENERLALEQQQALAKQQAFGQRKRTRSAKQSARPATLTALKVFGPGALAIPATVAVLAMLRYEFDSLFVAWLYFLYLGLPALLGVGVGMRVRHRPVIGTFCALGMLTPFVSLIATLAMGSFWYRWENLVQMALSMLLFWMPIGVVSAGLTGWGRDTLRRKRRQDASTRAMRLEE